jgi:lipopolysaccharide transport system ATP-binding protein
MKPIISVEQLSKEFHLGAKAASYATLRESVMHSLRSPFRRNGGAKSSKFVALKDINFEVKQGEIVGVIGRNGAGKSTLLKILSRITEPTTGGVDLWGRVSSLLEVGTGFHPELTGRENIYLNGAILGMHRVEIERKFDEMVAFAEVEKFIDTPIKRYSSGMYLRLAFAVAAHLEPEILLVDEVLAVGDQQFQQRCLGKMGEVAKSGRTVLFVSHNMAAVEALCNRCLLLEQGRLVEEGSPSQIISRYLMSSSDAESGWKSLSSHPRRLNHSLPIMNEVILRSISSHPSPSIQMGDPFSVQVRFKNEFKPVRPFLSVNIKTAQGVPVFGASNRFMDCFYSSPPQKGVMTCRFDSLPLMPGTYFIDLYFEEESSCLDSIPEAISFEVLPANVFGSGRLPPSTSGPVFWPGTWTLQLEDC